MPKNLMVCVNSNKTLKKINESAGDNGKYILEGVFAELDTLNRNKRIYPKDEYLKHLSYLRDDIKKGEPLLGELDHPEDRFEVKLKEASHRITDLWYDANTNCVMGKIELLNTPNGKLAQSLVDQGIPLHISSRAAGTVGQSDNKVSIQQIYTYDLVCKPGFAGAVLHRVNESEGTTYTNEANKFLAECNKMESLNAAPQFGLSESVVSIREIDSDVKLRSEAVSIKESDIEECDMKDDNKKVVAEDDVTECDAKKAEKTAEEVLEDDEQEEKEEKEDDGKEEDNKEEGEEDEGVKIISVEAEVEGDEGIEIKSVEAEEKKDYDEEGDEDEESEEKSEDEKEESEDKTEETKESEDVASECDGAECKDVDDKDEKCDDNGKGCDTKKMLCDCDELKQKKEKFEDKLDTLIATIKKNRENRKTNESQLISKYPTLSLLSGENLTKVMKLDESQKANVVAYLKNYGYCTPEAVNENWEKGVDYKVNEEVWLQYAPAKYKRLYENASEKTKASIRSTASYLLFENQYDVNSFWENTGLMEAEERRMQNEKFVNNMPKLNEGAEVSKDTGLPYSKAFIDMIKDMACEYNS